MRLISIFGILLAISYLITQAIKQSIRLIKRLRNGGH